MRFNLVNVEGRHLGGCWRMLLVMLVGFLTPSKEKPPPQHRSVRIKRLLKSMQDGLKKYERFLL